MKALVVSLLGVVLVSSAEAQPASVVGPLPGYGCMVLNLSQQQSMNPSVHVLLRTAPSNNAPVAGYASGIMIVPMPRRSVGAFTEVLFPTGKAVWIESQMLQPFHSVGDPAAKCRAVRLSDGRVGFETYH